MLHASDNPPSSSKAWQAWAVCGLLLLAIGLIYGQTLDFGFLDFDDNGFVYANPHVTRGLSAKGIKWAFTEGPFGEWYPLAPLSHMLDCQLFGLDPGWHHFTSLLLHIAASIGLFLVWWRMTAQRAVPAVAKASGVRADEGGPERDTLWLSAFVAAVFAVHPQHVESVAWIAERRDVLSGLFFMLTLAAYLGYIRHGRSLGRYCLVALALALGLMAKPMLVTTPFVLLLLDFWPLARVGSPADRPQWTGSIGSVRPLALVIEKIPLFLLSAGDCVITMSTHANSGVPWAWSIRLGNAAVSCVSYAWQCFYPVDLVAFYPIPEGGWPIWQVAAAVVILIVVSTAAVVWRRRYPFLFVGWFWYLGMLLPVLGLVGVSDHAKADRYMYLPGIGLYIAVTWGAARLLRDSVAGRRLLLGGAALALAGLISCSVVQTSYWRDEESLWSHALESVPDDERAEVRLGYALARQGHVDEAIGLYRRAEAHPIDDTPFNKLGTLLRNLGRLDEAIDQFREALVKYPDSFLTCVNLAGALAQKRDYDEALELLHRALEINPRGIIAYVTWAHLQAAQGKMEEARSTLEKALAIDPDDAGVHNDLGTALSGLGRIDEAIEQFEAALEINPGFALAHENLASMLAGRGRIVEAIDHYRRAVQLDPNNADARRALATLTRQSRAPR